MVKLTDTQIDQYRKDGFIILDKIIEREEAARLLERYEPMFERNEYETGVRPDEVNLPIGTPPYTKQICNGWRSDLTIAKTVFFSRNR